MPLDTTSLQEGITSLMGAMRKETEIDDSKFAKELAKLLETYIKTATVTVEAGIAVSTTGSPTAQTGATTTTGTGTIS